METIKDTIYRDDAIKEIKEYIVKENEAISEHPDDILKYNSGLLTAMQVVHDLPSADRPQGKWLLSDLQSQADNDNGNYTYVCTNCNHTDIHAKTQEVPYCWWCGARMKGASDAV